MASSTRSLVPFDTGRLPDRTCETVVLLTFARNATSPIVTLDPRAMGLMRARVRSPDLPCQGRPFWAPATVALTSAGGRRMLRRTGSKSVCLTRDGGGNGQAGHRLEGHVGVLREGKEEPGGAENSLVGSGAGGGGGGCPGTRGDCLHRRGELALEGSPPSEAREAHHRQGADLAGDDHVLVVGG